MSNDTNLVAVPLIPGIPKKDQYIVVIALNVNDDRWVYKPVGWNAHYYPFHQDEDGAYNEGTAGLLSEITDCIAEDITEAIRRRDEQ